MFLNSLKDTQKNLFLDLAIKAADASGGISEQEKNTLKAFALEMRIPAKYECNKTEEIILEDLKKCSSRKELKIVAFEILGIMYSDSEYDDAERRFVTSMAESFGIDEKIIDEMERVIQRYSSLYTEICEVVLVED